MENLVIPDHIFFPTLFFSELNYILKLILDLLQRRSISRIYFLNHMIIIYILFSSVVVLSIGLADFGFSIYHRIHTDESGPGSIGYAAHIGGGAAGILVGIMF